MKKLSTQYTILTLITAYFLFNSCLPREKEIAAQYGCYTFHNVETYADFLEDEGYSVKAAQHIAKVELNLIPADEYYTALMED